MTGQRRGTAGGNGSQRRGRATGWTQEREGRGPGQRPSQEARGCLGVQRTGSCRGCREGREVGQGAPPSSARGAGRSWRLKGELARHIPGKQEPASWGGWQGTGALFHSTLAAPLEQRPALRKWGTPGRRAEWVRSDPPATGKVVCSVQQEQRLGRGPQGLQACLGWKGKDQRRSPANFCFIANSGGGEPRQAVCQRKARCVHGGKGDCWVSDLGV